MKYQKRYTVHQSGPKLQAANPYANIRIEDQDSTFNPSLGYHYRTPSKSMGKPKRLAVSTK